MDEMTITALSVNIKVVDLARSRAFYEAFGFQQLGAFEGGVIYGVGGVALLELNARHPAVAAEVFQTRITTAKTSLMVHVPSLLPVLTAAEQAGIPLAVPPRRFPWKTIEVVVRDPDGFVVVFIAPDTPEESRAMQARTSHDLDRPG
jgi:catechol 2,3-dioxygenase-like lactoylglutathione lyase family enzyme